MAVRFLYPIYCHFIPVYSHLRQIMLSDILIWENLEYYLNIFHLPLMYQNNHI